MWMGLSSVFFWPCVCYISKCDFQILQKGPFVNHFVLSRNLDCVAAI